jgi:hypothetical protein
MTSPVNNANFTSPATRDTRQVDNRQGAGAQAEQSPVAPPRDDSVTLTRRPAAPAAETRIQSSEDARATLERVKQQLADNPALAVAAHGNIDPQSAAGALRLAA